MTHHKAIRWQSAFSFGATGASTQGRTKENALTAKGRFVSPSFAERTDQLPTPIYPDACGERCK